MKQLAVIGGGSWGTALSIVLAPRFPSVRLWVFESDLAARMKQSRENDVYLPGCSLPTNIEISDKLSDSIVGSDVVLFVVPSHHMRRVVQESRPFLSPGMLLVSASKGLENDTLLRMSEVIRQVCPDAEAFPIGVLSGPTFARDVAEGKPTALVIASDDAALGRSVQATFSGPTFRLYTSNDPIGVEVGGSVKNVVAIGAGVCHGLGLGSNAMAALITRGLSEITRLAVSMGGKPQTLSGLAGLGDLVLTCTGELSRNRTVGLELAKGRSLDEIIGSMRMVAEGVKTTAVVVNLAQAHHVDMPITARMYEMLHFGMSPKAALQSLMERTLKGE